MGLLRKNSGGAKVVNAVVIGSQSPSGSSGVLFSEDPGSDGRIVITGLMPQASQSEIEIKFGSRVVYSGTIVDNPQIGSLTISQNATSSTNEYLGVGTMNELVGDIGEILTVTKTLGVTSAIIHMSYRITD